MEAKELIKLNSREVRGNSNLMAIYITAFEKQFGHKPNCAGCTFNSDFQMLKNALQNSNNNKNTVEKMENTFQLRQVKGEILTYKKDGRTVRQYDNRMTEEFAIGFLTNGSDDQIAERKKMFKTLPKELKAGKEETETETVDVVESENNKEVKEIKMISENPTKNNNVKPVSKINKEKVLPPKPATSRKKKTDNE